MGVAAILLLASCGTSDVQDAAHEFSGITAELLGLDGSTAMELFVEDHVTTCMRADGFSYAPDASSDADDGPLPISREYAEQMGLGISFTDQSAPGELEHGGNGAILTTLSDEERAAWVQQEDECRTSGFARIDDRAGDLIAGLSPATRAAFESLATYSHPDLLAAQDAWSGCMQQAGYGPYANQVEMVQEWADRFAGINVEDQAALAAFQDQERAAAMQDHACAVREVAPVYNSLFAAVSADIEAEVTLHSLYSGEMS